MKEKKTKVHAEQTKKRVVINEGANQVVSYSKSDWEEKEEKTMSSPQAPVPTTLKANIQAVAKAAKPDLKSALANGGAQLRPVSKQLDQPTSQPAQASPVSSPREHALAAQRAHDAQKKKEEEEENIASNEWDEINPATEAGQRYKAKGTYNTAPSNKSAPSNHKRASVYAPSDKESTPEDESTKGLSATELFELKAKKRRAHIADNDDNDDDSTFEFE